MQRSQFNFLYSGLLTFGFCSLALAQGSEYEIDVNETTGFTVTGTSTLSDWTIEVRKIGARPTVLGVLEASATTVENFYFFASVEDLDGGRGASMNEKIRVTLNSEEFPLIEYRQTKPAIISPGQTEHSGLRIMSAGDLAIAGVSKPIELELVGRKEANGSLILQAQKDMKFSELNLEPPSAMFGQIVCGDDIQVNIILHLNPINQN